MTALQALWLIVIWLTGAATDWRKFLLLLLYTLICGMAIGYAPTDSLARMKQLAKRCAPHEWLLSLTLGVAVLGVGVAYASAQRGWPDEAQVFQASCLVVEQGVAAFFAAYGKIGWLGTQHPPLVPLLYGFAMQIFGVNVFVMRLISLLLGLATLLLTYDIGKTLYNRNTGLLAALFLLSTTFFWRLSATALTDMPVTFFFTLTLSLTLRLLRAPTYGLAVAVGLCIGAGLLCKYTMVFIYLVLFGSCLLTGSFKLLLPHLGVATLVSIGILTPWLAYASDKEVLALQMSTLTRHARFVLYGRKQRPRIFEWVLIRFPTGLGVYNFPLLFLSGLELLRRRSQADLFVLLWIVAVFLPLVLTLPNPRYFMPAFPALAIAMACGLERVSIDAERVAILALLYGGGAMFLYWEQAKPFPLLG